MKYSIGQVLFAVLNKKNQVYPMQVVEIITKKTLQGEEVQYLLQGGSDRSTTVLLDQVDGELFDSAEVARKTLTSRATKQINKLIDLAIAKSKEWYPSADAHEPQMLHDLPDFKHVADAAVSESIAIEQPVTVTLSDGTVAKIKMPSL